MPINPNTKIVLPEGWSQDQFDEVMAQCATSLKAHCLMFHGSSEGEEEERFNKPFSKAHDAFFEVWDDRSVKYILVKAHRGWGKTSIFGYGAPSQALMFGAYPFIAYVGATLEGGAQLQTENLKKALLMNDAVKAVIGDIATDRFSKDLWETSNGGLVFPRGVGQQVRGVLHGNKRLKLAIGDDMETQESVSSKEGVDKIEQYVYADLMGAFDLADPYHRLVVIQTVLGFDCLPVRLERDSRFVVLDFPLCDEKVTYSMWPERFPIDVIKGKYEQLCSIGRADIFAREWLNKPIMAADILFKKELFKYYSDTEGKVDQYGQPCFHLNTVDPSNETFVLVDPAKTTTDTSDSTAIVGATISFTPKGNRIFFRDVDTGRYLPDEMYERIFAMADRLGTRVIGFELNSLNEFARQPLLDYMQRRGKGMYEIVELKPRQTNANYPTKHKGKAGRVESLHPYYRMGAVYHNVNGCCKPLEDQLLRFPSTNAWDVMDAAAYIVQMLEYGDRMFSTIAETEEQMKALEDLEMEDPEMEKELRELEMLEDEEDDYEMMEVSYSRG